MIINKVTVGFVVQSFDTETQKWVSQEFFAGDDVSYEDKDGVPTDHIRDYLPFDMVQPSTDEGIEPGSIDWNLIEEMCQRLGKKSIQDALERIA